MLIRLQTLAPLDRQQIAGELARITSERLDAADVERVYSALVVHRATLYGAERLDANETMVLTQQLEQMRARTSDILRPTFKARLLVPFTSEVDPGAESWAYQQWDRVGMAKIVANYADDVPKVKTLARKFTQGIETIALGYEWSWLDMRRTATAGVPLQSRNSQAVRDGFEQRIERIAAIGIEETGVKGLLNHANVSSINAAAAAAGGLSPSWFGADKTAIEKLNDLHALETKIITVTKGVHAPDTLVMPLAHYEHAKNTPLGTPYVNPKDTILSVFLEKSANIRNVEWWHYCDTADGGTLPLFCMYKRDPNVVHLELPLEQQEMPPQAKGLAMEINSVGRIGGVAFEYPLAACYMKLVGAPA